MARLRPGPNASAAPQRRIVVFPGWFESNPYLNLMYLVPRTRGYEIVGVSRLEALLPLMSTLRRGEILHIHWTGPIAQYGTDEEDAHRRMTAFLRSVRRARRRGVRLLWTIHNRMPHECPYPEVEKQLLRSLAQLADLVIAINPLTREIMSDLVDLDERRFARLPHPHYHGVYADGATREEAREALGVDPGTEAVLFFGQMRRYKGLGTFFDAMSALSGRRANTTMLLAGKTAPGDREWIDQALPSAVKTVRVHDFVPDEDIQLWFRAADCVVLPFQDVLNSGSLFLSASFTTPLVLPGQPQLRAEASSWSGIRFYDPATPEALREAIEATLDSPAEPARASSRFEPERTPYRFSLAFDALLRRVE